MAHEDDERRWRKALHKLGMVGVRRHLQHSAADDAARSERPADSSSPPPRQFVDAWYREAQQRIQRAKNLRSYVLAILALAIVAAGIVFLAS